jgi:pimeloyl-ACP methyl ester carboxylesterase
MFGALAPALAQLAVPVCVLWGARDPYIPVRFAEQQRALFPRAEVHLLEDAGHWPFLDDPSRVKAVVVPFLLRQLGSPDAHELSA